VVLFFALFVGERMAGLLGVFLAIPVTGMILGWSRDEDQNERKLPDPNAGDGVESC
jgi:predicted PurR-regulated permease PerM